MAVLAILAATAAACATGPGGDEAALEAFARQHERDRRQMEEAKAQVAREKRVPEVHEFPGQGTVVVRDWFFEGLPGRERVRVRYSYENTTGRTFEHVRLWLAVRDSRGRDVERVEQTLTIPFGRWFTSGSTWSDEIEAATRGVHRDPEGWEWVIGCAGVPPPAWAPPVLDGTEIPPAAEQRAPTAPPDPPAAPPRASNPGPEAATRVGPTAAKRRR